MDYLTSLLKPVLAQRKMHTHKLSPTELAVLNKLKNSAPTERMTTHSCAEFLKIKSASANNILASLHRAEKITRTLVIGSSTYNSQSYLYKASILFPENALKRIAYG